MDPPKDAEAEVWRSLTGALGGPGGGSALPAGGLAAKYVAMAGVLMLATAGGATLWFNHHQDRSATPAIHSAASETSPQVQAAPIVPAPSEPVIDRQVAAPEPAPTSAPAHSPRPAHRPLQPTVAPPPAEEPAPAEETAPAEPPVNAAAGPASHLREEIELVRSARQALRAGRASQALQILDESRRRFPSAALEQERERLTIEALSASGRTAEASARAAAFLRKFPTSPHAKEIHELAR